MKNCAVCASPLSGRQKLYCSPICSRRAYTESRKSDGRLKAYREANRDKRAAWSRSAQEERACEACGDSFQSYRYNPTVHCSQRCAQQMRNGFCRLPTSHPVRRLIARNAAMNAGGELGPLRKALAADDTKGIIAALKERCETTASGCWEWQGQTDSSGYGRVVVGARGKTRSTHRVMAEAIYGPLGNEPVHHMCANRLCICPDHLQPISQRENVAEMLQRHHYLRRIADLEAALADLSPTHPLISAA